MSTEPRLEPLIQAERLRAALPLDKLVVVDCRFSLADPGAGRRAYAQGHIPGARYAHLDEDLSVPPTPSQGRHPLPDRQAFARRLGDWGIDSSTRVAVYDDAGGAIAARLWWMLRWLGHARVQVLDGGFPRWTALGYPVETQAPMVEPMKFEVQPALEQVVEADALAAEQQAGNLVLDARAAERYAGQVEPIDPVAGHVPGAVNHPFKQALADDGRFLEATQVRTQLSASLGGRQPTQAIAMCGSGVTACHLLLGMHVAGLPGARLFAGSWSEWIREPTRAVATGSEP